MSQHTLLVALAHPDDELSVSGTMLAQRARGDRVVLLWLTRGEMTGAFGPISEEEVAQRRMEQGRRAGEILGVETRFLDFRDMYLTATPEAATRVAREIAEIQPDGIVTWGDAWVRGMRHPDHQACGKIVRDAITIARIEKLVAPAPPHRKPAPVYTLRDAHSQLPAVFVDVEPHLDGVRALADFYYREIGFGDPAWHEQRMIAAGEPAGIRYAEAFDAWETSGGAVRTLLPALPVPGMGAPHPQRKASRDRVG